MTTGGNEMSKKIIKIIVAVMITINAIGMIFLGVKLGEDERIYNLLNILLIALIGLFLIIYLINLAIYLRNKRRRKIDAEKIEKMILKKKKMAEEDYQGYYRLVRKHLLLGDVYYFLIIFIVYLIHSIMAMLASASISYLILVSGALLYFTISFLIGTDVPPYDPTYELKEEDFPELWKLIRKVAAEYNVKKKIKCYFNMDCNASVNETDKGCTIFLGVSLLQLLNESELESILNHEFAHIVNKDTKRTYSLYKKLSKWMEVVNSGEGGRLLLSVLFSPLSNTLSSDFELFDFVSRRTIERIADLAIKDRADSQVFINALAKLSLYGIFDSEEAYPVLEVYEEDVVTTQYFNLVFNKFLQYYSDNKDLWNDLIVKRIPAQIESHLTFKRRMELLEVDHFEVEFNDNIDELDLIVARANELIVKFIEPTYEERRKRDYLDPLKVIKEYEENSNDCERLELFKVARAYRIFSMFDKSLMIYDKILSEHNDNPQAIFEKGTLLLSMFDNQGIEYIYQAIKFNENYLDAGVNIIGEYCLKMGLEEELEKIRSYRREISNYFFNVHVHKNVFVKDKFVPTTLEKPVMLEVIKFIKADHRVNRIFIADKKIDKEHRTTVIGYTINPEFGEELQEIHSRIFDYLDNDRREQYTLISLDENPIFFKKFKAIKGSLKYFRNS